MVQRVLSTTVEVEIEFGTRSWGRASMKPMTPQNSTLGFVGIGYMGRPIAQRLLESGFKLIAYDRERSQAERLLPFGGKIAESVAELSSSCNVILSCLPSDEIVMSTY